MNDEKLNAYAIIIMLKPKPRGVVRYKAKSFKGVVVAEGPAIAKKIATDAILNAFSSNDGSEEQPLITINELTVKECKTYGDFVIKQK